MTEKEALKLALEALKYPLNQSHENFNVDMAELLAHRAITAIKEALAEQPAQQDSTCSNALRIQHKAYPRTCKKCGLGPCVELAQQALDKMAENARELGLDYEPVWGSGFTNKDYEDAMRQRRLHQLTSPPDAFEQLMREADKPTQVPENIAKYATALMAGTHEITSLTIRPKRTWVGLTPEQAVDLYKATETDNRMVLIDAVEAKLRSKNEDRN